MKRLRCLVLAVLPLIAACGSPPPNSGARPTSLATLPLVAADISVSGPITGHVTQVRLDRCAAQQNGALTNFYTSVYFQLGDQWYSLVLFTQNPFPRGTTSGYNGPGTYSADNDFREVQVNPGGITIGSRAWGTPVLRIMTMTVAPEERRVTMGMVGTGGTISAEVEFWPKRPNDTAPAPEPTPSADQIVRLRGWWTCPGR